MTVRTGPGGTTTYTYDSRGRLTGVTTPTDTWTYRYDALGNRTSATHNGQATQYLVDPTGAGDVVGEYNGAGTLVAHYTEGLGLTSRVDASGNASYYDFDALGSTAGLTGGAGTYVDTYSYLPFGEVSASSGSVPNPFQYVGQAGVMNGGNGLDFMRARPYAPADGRFIQRDPLGLGGGDANLLRYAGNDPVINIDPSGFGYFATRPLQGYEQYYKYNNVITDSLNQSFLHESYFYDNGENVGFGPHPEPIGSVGQDDPSLVSGYVREPGNYDDAIIRQAVSNVAPGQYVQPEGLALMNHNNCQDYADKLRAEYFRLGGKVDLGPPTPGWVKFLGPIALLLGAADPLPAVPGGKVEAHAQCEEVGPDDPNFITGPSGSGAQDFVADAGTFPYAVYFENQPTAGAPALVVTVTQQLDPNLDWSTFQLGAMGFGNFTVQVPPGLQHYSTRVDATASLGCFVDVTADLNRLTGVVTCTFTTIDPTTLDIPRGDPLAGFLPPDDASQRGEGWISYAIDPLPSLPTGTVINAKGTVIFDAGLPDQSSLDTAPIFNTIDAGAPPSSVSALPAFSPASFTVQWSGQDDAGGSGIAAYDVYVSDNGGPFTPWLTGTTQTSALYTGADGHTYAFYTVATDNVGNKQAMPTAAQATTTADAAPPTSTVVALPAFSPATFTLHWSGSDGNGSGIATYSVYVSDNGAAFTPLLTGTTQTSTTFTGVAGHTYGFYSIATDSVGNVEATPAGAQATTRVQPSTAATTTTLTTDHPTGSTYGQAVTFTATVGANDPTAGTPIGSVQFQVDGGNLGPAVALVNGTASVTTSALLAGNHSITAVYTSDTSSFGDSSTTTPLAQVVNPAPLVVSADNQSKLYGAALPTLTGTLTGVQNGDNITASYVTAATAASHAGAYAITATLNDPNGRLGNYTVTNNPGTLTVTPAALTVSANDKTKVYGAALPALTVSYGGLVNGDTPATFSAAPNTPPSVTTAATAGSHVGTYAITASGAVDADYSISYVAGSLTVTPAALTISADDKSMTYGGTLPVLTASYSGLVNGDTGAAITGLSLSTVPASSHAGSYAITASGGADADYSITLKNGTLTITPAPLTITADSKTKPYGAALPTLTASYSGLVNGDTSASLATPPALSTTATASSPVGTYPITASGAADSDYAIGYVPGTLTVTPATLAPTMTSQTIGGFDPATVTWFLRSSNSAGPPGAGQFAYGTHASVPVSGDWAGTGQTGIGAFDQNTFTWFLRNEVSAGAPDAGQFQYGGIGFVPVTGDWQGSGHSGIGAFDPATATWYLRNEPNAGAPDAGQFAYGVAGGIPVVGDWTGTGHLGIGVFDPATFTWYLRSSATAGPPDVGVFQYGGLGFKAVAGDWSGTGHAGIGVIDPSTATFYLRNEPSAGAPDAGQFAYGGAGWLPVAGAFAAPQFLLAAGGEGPGAAALGQGQLQSAVAGALARLSAAGVDPALIQSLGSARFDVGLLPDGVLGATDVAAPEVVLSADAAGHGWFADPTPLQDEEFAPGGPGSPLVALPGSPAAGQEDLLTAVLHELGHLAGRPDGGTGLMAGSLAPGTRDLGALDQVFAASGALAL
jgi:RHS repeat-associated protein